MVEYPIGFPAAADVMTNDGVEHGRSISSCRRSFTNNLLNLLDAVFQPLLSKPLPPARRSHSSLTAFAPDQTPIEHLIDVAELTDCRIERGAGDGQRLIGAPEQLGRNLFAVDSNVNLRFNGSPFAIPQIRQPSPDGVTSE